MIVNKMEFMPASHVKRSWYKFIRTNKKHIIIADRGKPFQTLLPYREFMEIMDLIDELRNKNILANIAEARAAYKKTGGIEMDWKKLRGT